MKEKRSMAQRMFAYSEYLADLLERPEEQQEEQRILYIEANLYVEGLRRSLAAS